MEKYKDFKDHPSFAYYTRLMSELTNIDACQVIYGRIPDCDEIYFTENGCKIEELDFGTITTRITRISLSIPKDTL